VLFLFGINPIVLFLIKEAFYAEINRDVTKLSIIGSYTILN